MTTINFAGAHWTARAALEVSSAFGSYRNAFRYGLVVSRLDNEHNRMATAHAWARATRHMFASYREALSVALSILA